MDGAKTEINPLKCQMRRTPKKMLCHLFAGWKGIIWFRNVDPLWYVLKNYYI